MQAKSNPFNPNGIVPPALFAGRTKQALTVLRKLSETRLGRASSFFIYGEKGIGKSALASLIGDIAKSKNPKLFDLNYVVAYYPVVRNQSFESVLESALNNLTDEVPHSWLGKIGERLGTLFKNGKFSLGVFGVSASIDAKAVEKSVTLRDQAISILSNLVTTLREAEAADKRDGLLIVIDEVQNLGDVETAAPTLRGILSALDFKRLGNVSFMLIGLENAFDDFMAGDESARRAFDPVKLEVMPLSEAAEVLTKGLKDAELAWDKTALERNIAVTGGYPHSIQVVGHHLVDLDSNGNIEQDDWQQAIKKTATELQEKDFSRMYSFAGKQTGQEKTLNVLALFGPRMSKSDLVKDCKDAYGLANAYQYLAALEKEGSIRILGDGIVELHSELFRTAILSVVFPQLPGSKLGELWTERLTSLLQAGPELNLQSIPASPPKEG
jgi:hypothetical protein